MHDPSWLETGTHHWQKDDGNFTVFPTTQLVLGLFSPKAYVGTFGFDPEFMSRFIHTISENFKLDPELVEGFSGRIIGGEGRREQTYAVKSMSKKNREYTVILRNQALSNDDFETKLRWFKNTHFICDCGLGRHEGKICGMPLQSYEKWMTPEEYNERDRSGNKIYGEVACRHVIKALQKGMVYPFLDLSRFYLKFPGIAKALVNVSEERGGLTVGEADYILKPHTDELGFPDVISFFLNEKRREKIGELELKKLERTVYSVPRLTYPVPIL